MPTSRGLGWGLPYVGAQGCSEDAQKMLLGLVLRPRDTDWLRVAWDLVNHLVAGCRCAFLAECYYHYGKLSSSSTFKSQEIFPKSLRWGLGSELPKQSWKYNFRVDSEI